jgi:hypothetical protein
MKKIALFFFLLLIFSYCRNTSSSNEHKMPESSNKTGKELAQIYCNSCHQFPEPALLSKAIWSKELLPNMAARLGIKMGEYDPFKTIKGHNRMMIEAENIYPNTPLITQEDWDKIVTYYQNEAPDTLKLVDNKPVVMPLKRFDIKKTQLSNLPPLVTFTGISEHDSLLYIGTMDGRLSTFSTKNNILKAVKTYSLPSPPVSILYPSNEQMMVLGIGDIQPNEMQEGAIYKFDRMTNYRMRQLDMLKRPVFVTSSDNGKSDMLVCEYGYQKGQLSYYKKINEKWEGQLLSDTAGATKASPYDFNKDGLMDFAVLFAQGDERINIYYGKKDGRFQSKQVLQFPPVYGSSDIQLVDFDKNGTMDILYTNGDNEDFSMILKPYHGIRVYLNDGKDNYTERFFYPMCGAFQAKATDFDLDGDMDIVTTSFFPSDKTKPEAHFLYLEQTQPFQFKYYTFKEATRGKWMTLDVADADGDGDSDILLGSFVISLSNKSKPIDKKEMPIPFLFLENKTK